MSYASVRSISTSQIPVIDAGPLLSPDRECWRPVAHSLLQASSEVGFFYVRNHGVAAETIAAADRAARAFFQQPLDDKLSVAVNRHHHGFLRRGEAKMYENARADLKESFVWGLDTEEGDPERESNPFLGPNVWPNDMPALREALYTFYLGMTECAKRLSRAFALSLDLPEDFFVGACRKPISRGAVIYYPPQPPSLGHEQFGVAPHTDYGCMTLLWQDDVGGLEVKGLDREWVTAHPLPGTLVVNIGDLLARWTNDRFASTPHRVVNRHGVARHSMTLAFDPDYETLVDPSETCRAGETAKYPPVRCGDYVLGRFDAAFAYRKAQS
jgi:isopenicillin N synthase-like dioxygenase